MLIGACNPILCPIQRLQDLGHIRDSFTTASGREVDLRIYSEHANVDQLDFAMWSLRRSMIWDEKVYGREYDLDKFNIVYAYPIGLDYDQLVNSSRECACAMQRVAVRALYPCSP